MAKVVKIEDLAEHGFSAEEIEDMRATVRHLKEKGTLPPAVEITTEFINAQEEMVPTTTKFTRSQREKMDERAESLGETRSQYLRRLVQQDLATI